MIGIDTAACPLPDGTTKLSRHWKMSMPIADMTDGSFMSTFAVAWRIVNDVAVCQSQP